MSSGAPDDYYALLGIEADADDVALRRAWRQLALRWHPDRAGADATATFQRILAAYTVLSDPIERAEYDYRRGNPALGAPVERRRAPGVMLRRLSGPLNALVACGVARRAGEGMIDLFLNAEEVTEGGMVTISMRVPFHCPACRGTAAACARCRATGVVEELFSAWLAVPPGVGDGAVLAPSVLARGMVSPVAFRVRLDAGE